MIQKLLNKAISYLGVSEPTGDDQFIAYYNKIAGTNFNMETAWCAIFVTCVARLVGILVSVIPTFANCDAGKKWFADRGRYEKSNAYGGSYTPKPGDIVFYSGKYTQNDSSHVGYVVEVARGKLKAIEGNMSDAVGYRTISLVNSYIIGYGRVADFIEEKPAQTTPVQTTQTQTSGSSTVKVIWDYLMSQIGNAYGVAGLMGNLKAESGLKPTNLQNSYEKKLGLTDDQYTAKVDDGSYTNFVKDSAGYGLAQWTYWSRKQKLLEYVKGKGVSIGDLTAQLEFLMIELSGSYKGVLSVLKSAGSVKDASDAVITGFERPADQSDKAKNTRAGYGMEYFNAYANGSQTPAQATKPVEPIKTSTVKIEGARSKDKGVSAGRKLTTTADLPLRSGAGKTKKSLLVMPKGSEVAWYGYYTQISGVKWYLVKYGALTGFCSSQYLA